MEQHTVSVVSVEKITHDTLRIVTNRPANYNFTAGQATEIAIDKAGWQEQRRPFTFTNLQGSNYLEFIIKTYPSHNGMTKELLNLKPGESLLVHDVFGAITYQGKGVFIAGGAGITPFVAILRDLQIKNMLDGNTLLFANKTKGDIILKQEFDKMLGSSFVNILSREKIDDYYFGNITEDFLKTYLDDLDLSFYVCGPPPMMEAVLKQLSHLGVDESAVVLEI